MLRLSHKALVLVTLCACTYSCRSDVPKTPEETAAYLTNPDYGIIAKQVQGPFQFQLGLLPGRYLQAAHQTVTSGTAARTATFRFQLTAADAATDLPALLLAAAPSGWSADQVQTALLYHMDDAATLVIDKRTIRSVLAVAEAGPNTAQQIQVVFTFPIAEQALLKAEEIHVILANTFFLASPLTFTFQSADLDKVI